MTRTGRFIGRLALLCKKHPCPHENNNKIKPCMLQCKKHNIVSYFFETETFYKTMTSTVPMPLSFIIPPHHQSRARQAPPKAPILHLPTRLTPQRRHSLAAASLGQALSLLRKGHISSAFGLAQTAATKTRKLVCEHPDAATGSAFSKTHSKAIYALLQVAAQAAHEGDKDLAGCALRSARKNSFFLSPLYNLCEAKIAYHEGRPFRPDPAFPMAEDKGLGF